MNILLTSIWFRQSGKPRMDIVLACREANTYIETKGTEMQRNRYSNENRVFRRAYKPRTKQSKNGAAVSADVEDNENVSFVVILE